MKKLLLIALTSLSLTAGAQISHFSPDTKGPDLGSEITGAKLDTLRGIMLSALKEQGLDFSCGTGVAMFGDDSSFWISTILEEKAIKWFHAPQSKDFILLDQTSDYKKYFTISPDESDKKISDIRYEFFYAKQSRVKVDGGKMVDQELLDPATMGSCPKK